jgi:hypothetical protein
VRRPLPAGEDHTSQAAMEALHFAVRKLPTIGESTTEILRAIEGFESVVHWHGTDGHFLQSLGNKKPVIDLGKVFHRFLLPVRKCIKTSKALCKIDQAVAFGRWSANFGRCLVVFTELYIFPV